MPNSVPTNLYLGLLRKVFGIFFRLCLIILGPVSVAVVGGYFYATGGRFITTDNAYVKADKILVTAEVSGSLTEVAVSENLPVVHGQMLIRIDDTPFRIAVSRADARLDAVGREIDAARARLREEMAVQQAAEEKVEYLSRELERRDELQKRGVISDAALDRLP